MALGNGERYYSPSYARFIQQDSWLGNSAMPQSLNRFSYAYNNPFSYTDPSGNVPQWVEADRQYIQRERQRVGDWFRKKRDGICIEIKHDENNICKSLEKGRFETSFWRRKFTSRHNNF